MNMIKSINIKFPIVDDTINNRFFQMSEITKEAVSSDLLLLLVTQKGERFYMPEYGTNLIKFIFEQNDSITLVDIENEIKETVSRYIPYVSVDKILMYKNTDESGNVIPDNQLILKIKFTYSENAYVSTGELELIF